MKMTKKILALALVLVFVFSLTGCKAIKNVIAAKDDIERLVSEIDDFGNSTSDDTEEVGNGDTVGDGDTNGDDGDQVNAKSRDEVESTLTNYKITMEYSNMNQEKASMSECRWDTGYSWQPSDDSIILKDYSTKKMYILNTESKTGTVMADDQEQSSGFDGILAGWLFSYETYKDSAFTKTGSDTIAGRSATVYTFKYFLSSLECQMWIDDEYGITLKSLIRISDESESVSEVTEFKVGGVSMSDVVNLSDYDITDLTDLEY